MNADELAKCKNALLYSVADFQRMTGLPHGRVLRILANADLIPPRGKNQNRKHFISAAALSQKCPRLFMALRENMAEMALGLSAAPSDGNAILSEPMGQMRLFEYTIKDIAELTGLTRFQVRRALNNAGLIDNENNKRRIYVSRWDLMQKAPGLWEVIQTREKYAREAEAIDADFEGWGDE
jgi:hypothetical protein